GEVLNESNSFSPNQHTNDMITVKWATMNGERLRTSIKEECLLKTRHGESSSNTPRRIRSNPVIQLISPVIPSNSEIVRGNVSLANNVWKKNISRARQPLRGVTRKVLRVPYKMNLDWEVIKFEELRFLDTSTTWISEEDA
nr:hypothetical protein [Tanacetum cinerariifolium]